ncbi:MAG TPA: RnfABCDGE type electron transport complex subunit D [Polyangiaceae bacterium]|jgi:Na+-translocating ferredoxin:NAD+ oxidoreductase RnfD subunit
MKMHLPPWFTRLDPRLFVLANNALLLVLGMAFSGLQRDVTQLALALAVGLSAEWVLAKVTRKHAVLLFRDRMLSALVATVSTMILVRSPVWWFYGLLTGVAILSKYVLVDERGRHVFNPTNFAIVFALAFLSDAVFVRPDDFSGEPLYRLMIPVFGFLAVLRGARWRCSAAYFATVACLGVPLGMLAGLKPLWIVAPEMNTSTWIFAFLMIPDPKSSPASPRGQWLFGAAVATLHLGMRYAQVPYSPFVSLFTVTALRSVWRPREAPAAPLPA